MVLKLMEINCTGVWNLSALESGVNMPLWLIMMLRIKLNEENKEKE